MPKFKLNRYWISLLLIPPILTMAAEYVVNLNTLANAEELPFALVLLDKLYPVWGAIILGIILGLFLSIVPAKDLRYSQRLKRSTALGVIILNLAFLSFYAYLISVNGFKELNL
ncbi:hypothetical protein [uncultured Pontibacter sp.]|uniref:hypothetical protein n=1 Tax=uncultured Pontibacter sp. TaxID=453356 RepID=UPI00261807BD|nr:hypothetical protein [uncultured Pontibacter sp.]